MQNEPEKVEIHKMIHEIRGQKVMFDPSARASGHKIHSLKEPARRADRDLAELYQVEVKRLNEAVKRNIERFPPDFMFQLSADEWENLKSHFATSSWDGARRIPHVFTEHGIAMLSGLLNSEIAISVNIQIMRAFVELRHYVFGKPDTSEQIAELRKLLMLHIENNDHKFSDYDETIRHIVHALNNLIEQPKQTKRIGFNTD